MFDCRKMAMKNIDVTPMSTTSSSSSNSDSSSSSGSGSSSSNNSSNSGSSSSEEDNKDTEIYYLEKILDIRWIKGVSFVYIFLYNSFIIFLYYIFNVI